jgi:hypothetical protein
MKNHFFLLILFLTIYNFSDNKKTDYDYLLEWGKNHSVYISNKLGINYTNENNKNFYVKKKINPDEIIISIPKDILLNIDSALKLSPSSVKKQYEKYKQEEFKEVSYKNNEVLFQRIENSFLAYLITLANKNKSKKNKLYQFFKYFFNTLETNFDRFPLFYSTDQINIFLFSLFGNEIIHTRNLFEEEYNVLNNNIAKKSFDQDEYLKYRLFTYNKLVNISGSSSIVPFIDILDTNPVNFNLQINYTYENQSLSVISSKEIKPKNKLVIAMVEMTNMASLIIYGKTFEESKNYLESFKIAKISALFLHEKKLNPMASDAGLIDLMKPKYYEKMIPQYMELSKLLKEDASSVSAVKLILEYLVFFRGLYDKITTGILLKKFFDINLVNDIKSILETETNFLDKKIRELKKFLTYVDKDENKNDL